MYADTVTGLADSATDVLGLETWGKPSLNLKDSPLSLKWYINFCFKSQCVQVPQEGAELQFFFYLVCNLVCGQA